MRREIRLYGHLGQRFGRSYTLNVASPGEAVRALCSQLEGFRGYLTKHSEPGYRVYVGKRNIGTDELCQLSGALPIKIVPHVVGAHGKYAAALKNIVLGAVLIGASFITGLPLWMSTSLFTDGAILALAGVAQYLNHPPPAAKVASSYLFAGTVNSTAQGGPVPVLYGRLRVGSTVVSGSLTVGDIAL